MLHTTEDSADAVDPITGAGGFWRPFGDWDLDIPRIETNAAWQKNVSGWVVGSGSRNRCTGFSKPPPVQSTSPPDFDWSPLDWWYGYHLIVPGHGSQDLLDGGNPPAHQPASGSYPIVTKQDWMIGCGVTASDGGEGFVALSPDGVRYTFTHLVYRPMAELQRPNGTEVHIAGSVQPMKSEADFLPRYDAVMYVTQIRDRFGNTLTYHWSGNNLGSIVASDGRELDFSYYPGTSLVHTVTVKAAGGAVARSWTYTYDGSSSMPTLTRVQLPDGSAWSYQIGNLESATLHTTGGDCVGNTLPTVRSSAATGSMTAPSGLTAAFTLTPTLHGRSYVPKSCWRPYSGSPTTYANIPDAYYQFSVTKEVLSGPGIPTATWAWRYSAPHQSWTSDPCAANHTCATTVYTTVTDPLGQDKRYTFSNRFDASEGQLLRATTYRVAAGSSVLRMVVNSYANPTGGPWPGSYGSNLQLHINFAQTEELSPLAKRVVTQAVTTTFTTTTNTFDAYARPTRQTESSSLGYSRVSYTSYYDNTSLWVLGQVAKSTVAGVVATQTTYTSKAQPYKNYRFGKLFSTSSWNTDGTLASVTDGKNHKTTLSSWYRGVPRKVTYADGKYKSAVVNGNGWITAITDENGYVTHYGYDAMGRLASIKYPTGDDVAWNTTYLSFARVNRSEFGIPAGHWKRIEHTGTSYKVTYFDAMWRPLLTDRYDSADTSSRTKALTRYDAMGRVNFQAYPRTSVGSDYTKINTGIHTSYDALGRVTQVKQDSELGTLTTTTAYQTGFETKVTDPRGYSTVTSYQAFGEPTTQYPVTVTAPDGELTVIMRDAFGKPLSITRTGTAEGSPQVTRYYVYRPVYQTLCKVIEPETGVTVMDFDGAGNLGWSAGGLTLTNTNSCDLTAAWNSGRVVIRTYDARNRLATLSFPDGYGNQTWTYTPDGLPAQVVTSETNRDVTNTYTYDKRRLLTHESLTQSNWYTWSIGYGYDANAHLASEQLPLGKWYYAPDFAGRPTELALSAVGTYISGVQYAPDGTLKKFTRANGIVRTIAENTRLLPSRIVDAGGGVTPIDQRYTYDKDANPTAITDYGNSAESRTMTYDALDRLAGMYSASMDGQYNYSYDVLDNLRTRARVGGSTSTYYYDSHNRLSSIHNTVHGTTSYAWDVQGNLATRNGKNYLFSYGNRLWDVPATTSYRYDAWGRRVETYDAALQSAALSLYSRDGHLVYHRDSSAGQYMGHAYQYLGGKLALVADYDSGGALVGVRYPHTDAQGTIVAYTDANRHILSRSVYDSWGGPRDHGNDDAPGYTGHMQDSLIGLTYMQQRYYDPALARFISADPVGVDPATGGNFNRYWYAKDNPYRFTDPFGECPNSGSDSKKPCPPPPPKPKPKPKPKPITLPTITVTANAIPISPGGFPSTESRPIELPEVIPWINPLTFFLGGILVPGNLAPSDCGDGRCVMMSAGSKKGFWPGDTGAAEWGRRHGVGAREGKARFHDAIKQHTPGARGDDDFRTNPETGEVIDQHGDEVGNLNDENNQGAGNG